MKKTIRHIISTALGTTCGIAVAKLTKSIFIGTVAGAVTFVETEDTLCDLCISKEELESLERQREEIEQQREESKQRCNAALEKIHAEHEEQIKAFQAKKKATKEFCEHADSEIERLMSVIKDPFTTQEDRSNALREMADWTRKRTNAVMDFIHEN